MVTKLLNGGLAWVQDVHVGDRVLQINGKPTPRDNPDFSTIVAQDLTIDLLIERIDDGYAAAPPPSSRVASEVAQLQAAEQIPTARAELTRDVTNKELMQMVMQITKRKK